MDTPICDFVKHYAQNKTSRLHMPGHKGRRFLGCEPLDITEIDGADSLYEANGIILQSEQNATALFDTGTTLYSTEGSSQCIRAMLYLAVQARSAGTNPMVVAARNAHKAFLLAAALLDFKIIWLWDEKDCFSLCTCEISAAQLEKTLRALPCPAAAVYVTSPDYLGGMLPISELAQTAHRFGVPLLVDNAHGAYLHFLPESCHPIALGADICCDSAHKTLPVLTGGAYLHLARTAPSSFKTHARQAMALFGSTSPSYLTLQSLDYANQYLAADYRDKLLNCIKRVNALKAQLLAHGWKYRESDALKLTVSAAACGYTGYQLANLLRKFDIECEYADPDFLVLMFTPEIEGADFKRIFHAFSEIEVLPEIKRPQLQLNEPLTVCSVREAVFSPCETIAAANAAGRVLASPTVSCPPAVPIAVSGERLTQNTVQLFRYYKIERISVVK